MNGASYSKPRTESTLAPLTENAGDNNQAFLCADPFQSSQWPAGRQALICAGRVSAQSSQANSDRLPEHRTTKQLNWLHFDQSKFHLTVISYADTDSYSALIGSEMSSMSWKQRLFSVTTGLSVMRDCALSPCLWVSSGAPVSPTTRAYVRLINSGVSS